MSHHHHCHHHCHHHHHHRRHTTIAAITAFTAIATLLLRGCDHNSNAHGNNN